MDEQQNLAAELRRLADLIEKHPPVKTDINFRRPEPIEYGGEDGFVKYIPRDGYEYLKIEVHW